MILEPFQVALSVADALERCGVPYVVAGSRVNLFHRATSTKVDLFIAGGSPLDRQAMRRRVRLQVASGPDRFLYV